MVQTIAFRPPTSCHIVISSLYFVSLFRMSSLILSSSIFNHPPCRGPAIYHSTSPGSELHQASANWWWSPAANHLMSRCIAAHFFIKTIVRPVLASALPAISWCSKFQIGTKAASTCFRNKAWFSKPKTTSLLTLAAFRALSTVAWKTDTGSIHMLHRSYGQCVQPSVHVQQDATASKMQSCIRKTFARLEARGLLSIQLRPIPQTDGQFSAALEQLPDSFMYRYVKTECIENDNSRTNGFLRKQSRQRKEAIAIAISSR